MEAGAGDSKWWGKPRLDFLVTGWPQMGASSDHVFRVAFLPLPLALQWVPWPDLENMGPGAQARSGPPRP